MLQTWLRYDTTRTGCTLFWALWALRDYLRFPRHHQCAAVTLLLFSEHPLAVEQHRRGPTRRDRHLRICHWCCHDWAVEDEVHALLECDAPALANICNRYLAEVFNTVPALEKARFRLSSARVLDMLLRDVFSQLHAGPDAPDVSAVAASPRGSSRSYVFLPYRKGVFACSLSMCRRMTRSVVCGCGSRAYRAPRRLVLFKVVSQTVLDT
ncbi:hypothetical protein C8Q77DRAFT_246669 [Trametes polyzona]|nr:hypothetical protein C8Q77DRAFT_246669 [Trametes polyzona]